MNFRPIGTQVLIEYEDNKPVGAIDLPANLQSLDFSMFIVREVGGGWLQQGQFVPLPVKAGDRVKLRPTVAQGGLYPLEPHFVNDRKMAVVDITNIMGVWEGELPSPKLQRKIITGAQAASVGFQ